jgi:hypothetical protein
MKDVAAGQMRQESLDGVTDGLQLFLGNVMLLLLDAPKSSSLEGPVQDRSPSVARLVRV